MAKIKEITVHLGLSIDKNGVWIKPSMSLRVELEGEDQEPENRKAVVERCFTILQEDLESELERLLGE